MAKAEKADGFWPSMLGAGLYKRNQGRLTRQLTAAAIIVTVALGAWAMTQSILADLEEPVRLGIAGGVLVLGVWFAYRIVNFPVFADFLVDVEGELAKVSWPSREELKRATVVVLVTMFLLSFVLFAYDLLWKLILRAIGILQF
ncbi:MAG: preprotein translocase subunit SecE [Planctomycetaceae bacterium]|nr:preprotein translocase subunit SecE [Planctomycetaceae bacterium]